MRWLNIRAITAAIGFSKFLALVLVYGYKDMDPTFIILVTHACFTLVVGISYAKYLPEITPASAIGSVFSHLPSDKSSCIQELEEILTEKQKPPAPKAKKAKVALKV